MALLGGGLSRVAAAFGLGLSAMAFGFYLSDLGEVISSGGHIAGAGLVLGLLGWLLCTEGCVVGAIVLLRRDRSLGRPAWRRPFLVGVAAVLSIGLAVSFAPAWDSYHLFAAATGQTTSLTAGNVFANPAPVIAANLVIMILMVVLTILAVLWEPMLVGAALLAGTLVALGIADRVGDRSARDATRPEHLRHQFEPGSPGAPPDFRRPDADLLRLLRVRRRAARPLYRDVPPCSLTSARAPKTRPASARGGDGPVIPAGRAGTCREAGLPAEHATAGTPALVLIGGPL